MLHSPERVRSPVEALRIVSEEHPCPYLPPRRARHEFLFSPSVEPDDYHRLMDLNYRRSGLMVYRPICAGCTACRQLRVRAPEFRPNRSQRRNAKTNADLLIRVGRPILTRGRWDLYRRYQAARHGEHDVGTPAALEAFLYSSCVSTAEWRFVLNGRLVMVGIVDICRTSLSAVYCYWEPALTDRGLGTFNVLSLIDFAAAEGIPYVYLGYHVRTCRKMTYKSLFRPCEELDERGVWRRVEADPSPDAGPARGA